MSAPATHTVSADNGPLHREFFRQRRQLMGYVGAMVPLALANMFVSNPLARKCFGIVGPALLLAAAYGVTPVQVCTPPVSQEGSRWCGKAWACSLYSCCWSALRWRNLDAPCPPCVQKNRPR